MATPDQSIVDVVRRAIHDAQELMRSEIALAKAEAREELSRLAGGAALLAAAAASVVIGLVFLLTAVAWGLSEGLAWPVWSGFAVVAVLMLVLSVILAVAGRSRIQSGARMPLTVETLKENVKWMRARTP